MTVPPLAQLQGLTGVIVILALCGLMSAQRRRIDWRLVGCGLLLQFAFAAVVIRTTPGQMFFRGCNTAITTLLEFSKAGTSFLLQSFVTGQVEPAVSNLAFEALPSIIFFSSLLSVLYHFGIMQRLVQWIAWGMMRTMRTSGAETLSVAGNIFVGQTEAPLLVRPYVDRMTRSELNTMMCGGFATIAGTVMGLYVSRLQVVIPDIAGHLMAASVMSAPAAILLSKMIVPETEEPMTRGVATLPAEPSAQNVIEAVGEGAAVGARLLINILAMLIAFVAMMTLVNAGLAAVGNWLATRGVSPELTRLCSLEGIFGKLFQPLAWTLGVSWAEAETLGQLLGKKLVLTELIAYFQLSEESTQALLRPRSAKIASYALCGFANFASIGIQLGGIGAIAPGRRKDLSSLAIRAMLGGALATCLSAAVAGLFLPLDG